MKAKIISFEKYKKMSVKRMSKKNTSKEQINDPDYLNMVDGHEKIILDNWALRAFGALLETCNFEYFNNSEPNSDFYRYGLKRIVECYVDHQEKKLNEIQLRFKSSFSRNEVKLSA